MSNDELTNLKQQRGQIKAKVTRLKKFFDNLDIQNLNETSFLELENRFQRFEPVLDEFEKVQGSIEILATDFDLEQLLREEFEDAYHSLLAQIKGVISSYKLNLPNNVSSSQTNNLNLQPNNFPYSQLKLPSIKLPTFNGNYTEWIEFRDAFNSMIHDNNAISNIDKFYYLRSSLGGEASKVIESLKPSNANYDVAWQLLLERFENTRLIIYNHIAAIFDQRPVREESHIDLRKLLDNITAHLRNLKILGEPTEHWDSLIIHIFSTKFDKTTMREWESYKIAGDRPTIKDLNTFLSERCRFLEKVAITQHSNKDKYSSKFKPKNSQFSNTFLNTSNQLTCYYCKKGHTIYHCGDFLQLTPLQRETEVIKRGLCSNCLKPSHKVEQCKMSNCKKCGKRHNSLLHIDKLVTKGKNDQANVNNSNNEILPSRSMIEGNNTGSCNIASAQSHFALLSTAVVYVKNSEGSFDRCRVLLDNGAQNSFVTERLCKRLKLQLRPIEFSIIGVGQKETQVNYSTKIELKSCNSSFNKGVFCLVLPEITGDLPTISFDKERIKIPDNLITELADPCFNEKGSIDILLGSDIFWEILGTNKITLDCGLILYNTRLGYIMSGNVSVLRNKVISVNNSINCTQILNYQTLEDNLVRFWQIEEINATTKNLSDSDILCENHFLENHTRDDKGHFIVSIPFKSNYENLLGNSKDFALKRFYALEKRLLKDNILYEEYKKVMAEYDTLGHMSKVKDGDLHIPGFYLPHHAVVKSTSLTTKVRIVYDASMKSDTNYSLNDVQYTGPVIQNDLFSIILRFRKYRYVMTADISKMYRMIHIDNNHKRFHRIFWRSDPTYDVQCFEMNRVVFGTASAPFLAVRCLYQLGVECETINPRESEIIKNDFYVDDCLTGTNCIQELLDIQKNLSRILKKGGFELRKWLTNAIEVSQQFEVDNDLSAGILQIGENEANKTLGILWNANSDTIEYSLSNMNDSQILTKRSVLSHISQIYDPLGLLGPIIISAKLLMQDMWKEKISWDSNLTKCLSDRWLQFKGDLQNLNSIKIPRQVISTNHLTIEFHGFADASEKAYGCCIYVRCQNSSMQFTSKLVCAKSKVAPLKRLTLPRLELCSAYLLAQLTEKVRNAMKINFDKIYLWSDSTIALCWIRGCPSRWKSFVANRVSEIQRITNINDWHHVRSVDNPADLISRGMRVSEMINSKLWWTGPEWLSGKSLNFSSFEIPDQLPEQKIFVNIALNKSWNIFEKYSLLTRLQRINAYCLRYFHNLKQAIRNRASGERFAHNFCTGELSVSELNNSLNKLILIAQKESFPLEYRALFEGKIISKKSNLLSLDPFMDNEGLLRVGGRLQKAAHEFDKKHPIILPKHKLTQLILRNEHVRLQHCGPTLLLCSVRERFWPINGKNLAKHIIRKCVLCFKANPVAEKYFMGNLPEFRVNQYLPFFNTGLDYAGPLLIKDRSTRGAKLTKAYICLFVCMSVKAIHLELVPDLTTECFLAALKRFIGRRGKPSNIYSDNAKNFVGANAQLRELGQLLEKQHHIITKRLAEDNIQWHFIPSRAPNFGGIWEAGIKRVKFHLKRILGEAHLTYEEFLTVLIQIESILNSRPLCPLNSTPDQLNPLTPAHFLIGRALSAIPEPSKLHIPQNRLKQYQRLQQLTEHFWVRWHREYLSELQCRVKWREKSQNFLKVGTLVLVKEDSSPVMRWHMGRIVDLHPGEDKTIRVVTLKMNGSQVKRSVQKLCIFPFEKCINIED